MVLAAATPEALPVDVLQHPRWRVNIRPFRHTAERFSLAKCEELVRASNVSLRGWDYPHVDHEHFERHSRHVQSWANFMSHVSFWRLFQSGQFVHLFRFREDMDDGGVDLEKFSYFVPFTPANFEWKGFADPTELLYTLTEIYEFASRLAYRGDFSEGTTVSIGLHQVRGRVLYPWPSSRRFWSHFYALNDEDVLYERQHDLVSLIGTPADLALDAAVWFFERFGWDPPRSMLAADQERLLARDFR